ncbi:hypothetical protein QBC47DRAFT_439333 [Echria macrotheca]|uniref:FAD-binding domain-containing protein n=1 Tax=Echria macrotheca TaxID=438768 RepID=A0AAJ0B3K9_9PEZI|nr:hypothetical protein QBC47DRAFT_439333 [Echria macrotheca]
MVLKVVIVGGGIAGLSAAIAMRRVGHNVSIYEQSSFSNEVGAAVTISPNAARLLLAWGIEPITNQFTLANGIGISVGATKARVDFAPLGEMVGKLFGKPFYFAHRVDLHEALRKLAIGEEGAGKPAVLHLNSRIESYDPEAALITLRTGEVVQGDIVIAADGVHSLAIEYVLGRPNPAKPQELYNGCYRFLIPASELDADPETQWWNAEHLNDGHMRIFMNGKTGNRLVSYPCKLNKLWNCVGMFNSCGDVNFGTREDWHKPVDKAQLLSSYADFHSSIIAVLKKARDIKRWPLLYRGPIPTWSKGYLVLVGDAAHPMLPHQGQGAPQGIEDAIALGLVLSTASHEAIPARLAAFDKIRRARASALQIMSNAGLDQQDIVQEELSKYLDVIPKSRQEFAQFSWGHDVVRETVKVMREMFDDEFSVPEGFFVADPHCPEVVMPPCDMVNGQGQNGQVQDAHLQHNGNEQNV